MTEDPAWVEFAIGLFAVLVGCVVLLDPVTTLRRLARSRPTTGVVTEIRHHRAAPRNYAAWIRVRFEDESGVEHVAQCGIRSLRESSRCDVGAKVPIRYDPRKPSWCWYPVNRTHAEILLALGVVTLLIGFALIARSIGTR